MKKQSQQKNVQLAETTLECVAFPYTKLGFQSTIANKQKSRMRYNMIEL